MSIRTRLFLGTTSLVLALVAVQYWLQSRQVAGLQRELAGVAASVGEGLVLSGELAAASSSEGAAAASAAAPGRPLREPAESPSGSASGTLIEEWIVETPAEPVAARGAKGGAQDSAAKPAAVRLQARGKKTEVPAKADSVVYFHKVFVRRMDDQTVELDVDTDKLERDGLLTVVTDGAGTRRPVGMLSYSTGAAAGPPRRVELKVVAERGTDDNFLIVSSDPGVEQRVRVPVAPTERLVRSTFRQGLLASGLLLAVGIFGAAVIAHRVTRPVRTLAMGVEAVGMGGFGTLVEVTERGEIGELQQRFNTMSGRLATLETEKQAWAAKEHLAELGSVARGLGHTLRNPLNTLGLVVEELAGKNGEDNEQLVATARAQIRRIDRWLLSFLALGAGRAAEPERVDLRELVREVVLEAVQAGGRVSLTTGSEPVAVEVVPRALVAAFTNLLENALDASPADRDVEVSLAREDAVAVVTIVDHGEGLAPEVRERLFEPHVTSKPGGSGMGLFLSRQLVEAGHGGALELRDGSDGGTVAVVRLPLAADQAAR